MSENSAIGLRRAHPDMLSEKRKLGRKPPGPGSAEEQREAAREDPRQIGLPLGDMQ
jgi:hypothetical protein